METHKKIEIISETYLRVVGFTVVKVATVGGSTEIKNRHIWKKGPFPKGVFSIPNSLFA